MSISSKDFVTLVQEQVAAVQGKASALVDLTIGSLLRAVLEATAGVALWLQGLILTLLVTTRAATASGTDLDTWMADYGVVRLPAVAASGSVTFSRFTASGAALVPVGALVQTGDGSQQFTVQLDTSNPAYSAAQGGYVLANGVASISLTVAAVVAGSAGNVTAGSINTIAQAIPGIDTVTNGAALTTGQDAESDEALRARFIQYINSLSKATKAAVLYAVLSLQQNVSAVIVENLTYAGNLTQNGYFYAVVDDGTGNPSSTFLASAANAIEAARPLSVTYGVFGPSAVTANVVMAITTAAGYIHADVVAQVTAALQNYINTLGLGNSLSYTKLANVAYAASAGVTNVSGVLLNGATTDLAISAKQTAKAGTITVT
ncbi:baseplate J/gp47 family protein [Herbaspirillum sp. WKF16]|uniref:baseplate J/gp47 family protein n=1 Tax=Herbaspirillum sp. WKF16 TaxID=3028312 RepID=UPI0023A9AA7A|nr:baseplate J/gp47 family protein [Herbaspirillum sp. WKF16]WDZ97993.1 baseplate J/gp47 family protein [Herbaspirillum sp. WKF16]